MITPWLVLSVALVAVGWFAAWSRLDNHWRVVTVAMVPLALVIAWQALKAPLSHPADNPPAGKHVVLGARIDVDKAIYVMLDAAPVPRYYVLPYSNETADKLQQAMDQQRGVVMDAQDSDIRFSSDDPVGDGEPKSAETPFMRLDGPHDGL